MKTIVRSVLFSVVTALVPIAAVAADGGATVERVDINTADIATLAEGLAGIGEARAEAIIAYRQLHGDFKSAEELAEVKGIGEKILEENLMKIRLK